MAANSLAMIFLFMPPIILHRRPIPIARSLCLYVWSYVCQLRCILWLSGARYAYIVYRSRIGMLGWHFDLYHCRSMCSPLPPNGCSNRGHNLTLKLSPSGCRSSKTLYLYVRKSTFLSRFFLCRLRNFFTDSLLTKLNSPLKNLSSSSAALVPKFVCFPVMPFSRHAIRHASHCAALFCYNCRFSSVNTITMQISWLQVV